MGLSNLPREGRGTRRAAQHDDRAAEACAGHPRRERTGLVRELDEHVELGRRDLEVAPKTLVCSQKQRAECLPIRPMTFQNLHRGAHAGVLRNRVPQASQRDVVETCRVRGGSELGDGQRAGRPACERRDCMLELAAALGVTGIRQKVGRAGVDDHDRDAVGQRDESVLERAGVEQYRVTAPAENRRRLIHQTAGNADGAVLRRLSRTRERERLELETNRPAQSQRKRDLQRRRRGETRSNGKVGGNVADESDPWTAACEKLRRHGGHVSTPTCGYGPAAAGVDLDRREPVGGEHDRSRSRRRNAPDPDAELERGRKDEPTGVIGVLADEVDTPRREERPPCVASDRAPPAATESSAAVSQSRTPGSVLARLQEPSDGPGNALVLRRGAA